MSENSSQDAYVAWTKQQLDEMDAALASLEAKASRPSAEAKVKAAQLNADMKKRRGDFEAEVKGHLNAGEAALQASKPQLEKQWANFEAELKTYVETTGKDIDQKRALFVDIAAAQTKAWGEAVEKLQSAAADLGAGNEAKIEKAIAQLRSDCSQATATLKKLEQAGGEFWAALSAALQVSRKKLDEASQNAWETLKSATSKIKP